MLIFDMGTFFKKNFDLKNLLSTKYIVNIFNLYKLIKELNFDQLYFNFTLILVVSI